MYNFLKRYVFDFPKYNIIDIMFQTPLRRRFLYYQPHIFHMFSMFRSGGYYIYPRGVDTAMAKDIRKFCDILFYSVKNARE